MYKKKSLFITFEGIEGSGKSYQSKKLFEKVKKLNIPVILTREPGGSNSAEIIRKIILTGSKNKFLDLTDTFLYFAARKDFLIIKGGENIYPAEIENTIYQFKKVNECAVVGYDDKIYGEEIYAFVKFKKYKSLYEKQLNNFLVKNLARFKLPKKIFYFNKELKIKDFPKTTTQKIKYKDLKNILKNEI